MENVLRRVTSYVKTVSIVFLVLETILGLVVGGIIGALIDAPTYPVLLIIPLVISLPMFLALLCVKAFAQASFPAAAVEELQARCELDSVKKDVARKRTIDGYIEAAIRSLNLQTCSLTQEQMNDLCERNIEDGLRSVIGPVIQLPNYILDCNRSDFTIGAYLVYSLLPSDPNRHELDWVSNIFVLRDDFGLGIYITPDLVDDQEASGTRFELRNALQKTHNHQKYFESVFPHEEADYTIVTSPIPQVCEGDYLTGVLFIVAKKLDSVPEDVERVLLIFGRILANWLSKYDDCNWGKLRAR